MCGIVGYVGHRVAADVVVEGLRRLEYRGYDSAGVAVPDGAGVRVVKRAGKIANLEGALAAAPLPRATAGVGHTRWATHGPPSDVNAHPHVDCTGRIALVHNGIIENYAGLRDRLEATGHGFASQTDSEVVVHLLEQELPAAAGDLAEAMRRACRQLAGSFTLVAVDAAHPDVVVAARRNSPLVLGRGSGEYFLASDVAAFIAHTRDATELGQDQVVRLTPAGVAVTDLFGTPAAVRDYHVDWDTAAAEKAGFDCFMRKEIAEQPRALAETLLGRCSAGGRLQLDEMRLADQELRDVDKVIVVACGSAYHSGLIAKYAIEHWTRIPCEVELASEFRYRDPILTRSTLVVAVSQSGETMDTLMAVRHAREQRARVLAICNTNGSTIPRESDAVLYTHAGPEIAVASTKAVLTQVVACELLALYLAQLRGTKFGDEVDEVIRELSRMPEAVERVIGATEPVAALARDMVDATSVLYVGRHVGYPVALEGALKLKELAYIHAEGFAAGELKHGPIALIEAGQPVFVVVPPRGRDALHDKVIANLAEIRARGARTVVLAEAGDDAARAGSDVLIPLPPTPTLLQPLVALVPLQVFACELAIVKGHDVDQPRNLAKSVTVE